MKNSSGSLNQIRKPLCDRALLCIGIALIVMEAWKQIYLYTVVFNHSYNVWYFPFQLCSTPMYLCVIRYFLTTGGQNTGRQAKIKRAIDAYLMDFGMLGGIAALAVPDGFTHPDHPLLTLHGYLWHILLITISIIIFLAYSSPKQTVSKITLRDFGAGVIVFLLQLPIAELINVILATYGDCDMFYISPYHLSSQPVFHDIDGIVGRGPGIAIYILAIIFFAYVVHCLMLFGQRIRVDR